MRNSKFIDDLERLFREETSPAEFGETYLASNAPSRHEVPEDLFHELNHFIDDADLKEKDPVYRKIQRRELFKLIFHLKRGANNEYLKDFTFSKSSDLEAFEYDEIRKQIDLLNILIPETTEKVMLIQDGGGPDESSIRGSKLAFFKFGLRILQIPFAELIDRSREPYVRFDLHSAIDDRSDIGFDGFLVSDALPNGAKERELPPPSLWEKTKSLFPILFLIWFLLCSLVGCGHILSKAFGK